MDPENHIMTNHVLRLLTMAGQAGVNVVMEVKRWQKDAGNMRYTPHATRLATVNIHIKVIAYPHSLYANSTYPALSHSHYSKCHFDFQHADLAMVRNLPHHPAAIRAMRFVRHTERKIGLLILMALHSAHEVN